MMTNVSLYSKRSSEGFTLLELLVAMAIFAMLAFSGWQVFNSINRSKERAEIQMDIVTDLQYGYQQMQRDMIQVVDYKLPSATNSDLSNPPVPSNSTQAPDSQEDVTNGLKGAFSLANNRLSFIRYADPDPRYAQSANFERIVYIFNNGNLIRERYTTLNDDSNEKPLQSIIVSDITDGRFRVLLPEPSIIFPNNDTDNQAASLLPSLDDAEALPVVPSLPNGITVNFDTQLGNVDTPIEWVYAISDPAPKTQGPKRSDDDE